MFTYKQCLETGAYAILDEDGYVVDYAASNLEAAVICAQLEASYASA